MDELTRQGLAICMVSSELPGIMGVCYRIYVLNNGKIVGECTDKEATQVLLMKYTIS